MKSFALIVNLRKREEKLKVKRNKNHDAALEKVSCTYVTASFKSVWYAEA